MRFAVAASALALASTALAVDHQVIVGSNGTNPLQFNPNSITANISDTVTFVFNVPGTNHTVAQSLFAKPCEPATGGFASGYIPGDATNPGKFTLNITDTKPIWFYCAQEKKTHCIAGMVGAINPPPSPATNDLSAFVALATSASSIVQPTPALSGIGAFATASAIAPSVTSSTNASTSASGTASPSGTNAAVAGKGVSGGVVAALAAAFGVALL